MKRIILASTSPQRKNLLAGTGLLFEAVPSGYEEDMALPLPPTELAKHLSAGKAESIAPLYPDAIIIGADTFISFEGEVLGKPYTAEKAKLMLQRLCGNMHTIITGYTVIDTGIRKQVSEAVETKVYFKPWSEEEIDEYIATGEPLDKAGSYAMQGLGRAIVEKIDGDYSNVVGLPVNEILKTLKDFGIVVETGS